MLIIDYPAISYRAVHFDVKHHLGRMEYYYQEIDKLARYKINAVIWELEDKLRYTRRPEIGAPNAIKMCIRDRSFIVVSSTPFFAKSWRATSTNLALVFDTAI